MRPQRSFFPTPSCFGGLNIGGTRSDHPYFCSITSDPPRYPLCCLHLRAEGRQMDEVTSFVRSAKKNGYPFRRRRWEFLARVDAVRLAEMGPAKGDYGVRLKSSNMKLVIIRSKDLIHCVAVHIDALRNVPRKRLDVLGLHQVSPRHSCGRLRKCAFRYTLCRRDLTFAIVLVHTDNPLISPEGIIDDTSMYS